MKNINDIIKDLGIELDDEKAQALSAAVLENYRTLAEVENKASRIAELESQLSAANEALEAAKTADMTNSEEVASMREKIANFEEAEKARTAELVEKQAREAFGERFTAAIGTKQFANPIVGAAIAEQAYETSKANPDMALQSIIDGIVGDSDGVWVNPQQAHKKMPATNDGDVSVSQSIQSLEDIKGMTVDEVRARMKEIDKLLG